MERVFHCFYLEFNDELKNAQRTNFRVFEQGWDRLCCHGNCWGFGQYSACSSCPGVPALYCPRFNSWRCERLIESRRNWGGDQLGWRLCCVNYSIRQKEDKHEITLMDLDAVARYRNCSRFC